MRRCLIALMLCMAVPALALWGSFGSGAGDLSGGGTPAGGDYLNIPEYNSTVLLCEFTNSASTIADNSFYGLQAITNGAGGAASTFVAETNGISTSRSFDGGDLITVTDNNNLSFGNGSTDSTFTVACWIKPSSIPAAGQQFHVMDKENVTGNKEWRTYLMPDGDTRIITWDNSTGGLRGRRTPNNTVAANVWHFFVATYDATAANSGFDIYANGVDVDSADVSSGSYVAMENTATDVSIGSPEAVDANFTFEGDLDMPMIFSQELTANDVSNLFWNTCWNNPTNEYDGVQINPGKGWTKRLYDVRDDWYNNIVFHLSFNPSAWAANSQSLTNYNFIANGANVTQSSEVTNAVASYVGNGSWVEANDNSAFSFTSGGFSCGADLNMDDADNSGIIAKYDTPNREWALWKRSDKKFQVTLYDESSDGYLIGYTTAAFNTGQWYNVVATIATNPSSYTDIKIYVDGIEQALTDNSAGSFTALEDTSSKCYVGAADFTGGAYDWDGKLDNAFLVSQTLSSNQVFTFATTARGE